MMRASPATAPPARVLVVEDEFVIATAFERMLTRLGFAVVGVVSRSAEVASAVERLVPDVVMMDVRLDGGDDGITIAEALYARAPVAVIFVTAFSDAETVERMARAGAYGCVIKPVDEERLFAALRLAIAKHRELLALRGGEPR